VHRGLCLESNDEHIGLLCKVKNTTEYCLKRINKCKHGPIDGILSGHGGKTGTYYPDLEPGNEFWNRVWVPGSGYKSLVSSQSPLCQSGRKREDLWWEGFVKEVGFELEVKE